MQKLPIGEQYFARLRERNNLYVDKTELIYELMHVGTFVFLARPRRFGKSLLTTTLQEIFRGNQPLFQGLWIEDKIDWQPKPVLLLNFNAVSYRAQSLAQGLTDYLDELAAEHGVALTGSDYKEKFRTLIRRLREQSDDQRGVVLLIDEYDKPITDLLENEQKVQENIDTLKDFYAVLKAPEAQHLHFTFITGVSKYGKLSIFSDLNNLLDITLDPRFATLLGYTQDELENSFGDYIDRLANSYAVPHNEVLEQIAFWYNGYSWDGIHRVCVPFSTLTFLELQTFDNHWFATATPTFLIKLLKQHQIPAYELESVMADNRLLDSADVNNLSVIALLFQTGYLTIKHMQRSLQGNRYELGYPNHEVAQSFQQYLLADYLDANLDRVSATFLEKMRAALEAMEVDGFITVLQALFASIPSHLFLPQEAYYHSVVYLTLKLLGFTIHAERSTNLGRIDALIEMDAVIYILEFKMTTGQAVIAQMHDRQYAQPFLGSSKTIILLGIAFDKEQRNIGDWQHEILNGREA